MFYNTINREIYHGTREHGCHLGTRMRLRLRKVTPSTPSFKTNDWVLFYLGVFLSFLTTLITTAYGPIFRKQIKIKATSKIALLVGYIIEYLLKLYVMLLMMTMNGQVCIAIALGMGLGVTFFNYNGEKIRKKIFRS